MLFSSKKRFMIISGSILISYWILTEAYISSFTSSPVRVFISTSSSKTVSKNITIFDTHIWLRYHLRRVKDVIHNVTARCDVPDELKLLATGLCKAYQSIEACNELPCSMIHDTMAPNREIICYRGGRMQPPNDNDRSTNTTWTPISCKLSYSLDVFADTRETMAYPSIYVDGFPLFSTSFFRDTLSRQYRSPESIWGFYFNFESSVSYPWAADPNSLNLFNITHSYNRQKHDFLTVPWLFDYVHLLSAQPPQMTFDEVISRKKPIVSKQNHPSYWTNTISKELTADSTNDGISSVTAPIMWMNSNCDTPTNRTAYMDEFMQYIDVDNYGNCGKNKRELPQSIVGIQKSENCQLKNLDCYNWRAGKLALAKNYLFTIAIENSVDYDYITEKLWQPLAVGSIPIYLGAPNVEDWLPCENDCIIDLRRFSTPKDAAEYIQQVATNKTLYESFHRWRTQPMRPKFQKLVNYFFKMREHDTRCMICDAAHRVQRGETIDSIKAGLKSQLGEF